MSAPADVGAVAAGAGTPSGRGDGTSATAVAPDPDGPVLLGADARGPDTPEDDPSAPLPEVRGVPGWALHLGVLVAGLALTAAAVDPHAWPSGTYVVLGLLALGAAAFPASPALVALLLAAAGCQVLSGGVALDVRLVATALLLDVVHVLGAVTAAVPMRARVDPRALLPSARRLAVVVALSVPVFAVVRVVGAGSASSPLFVLTAAGALAVVVAALVLAARSR